MFSNFSSGDYLEVKTTQGFIFFKPGTVLCLPSCPDSRQERNIQSDGEFATTTYPHLLLRNKSTNDPPEVRVGVPFP